MLPVAMGGGGKYKNAGAERTHRAEEDKAKGPSLSAHDTSQALV